MNQDKKDAHARAAKRLAISTLADMMARVVRGSSPNAIRDIIDDDSSEFMIPATDLYHALYEAGYISEAKRVELLFVHDYGKTYRVVRMYFNRDKFPNQVVEDGLSLADAQAMCRDPETSSKTCKGIDNVNRTSRCGQWFCGYEEE